MIQALCFYLFSAVAVASAVMVIAARNPVHSVLFLILAFFSAAALFLLLGAEFIAMILLIVYVGAVAVLFLFVVMMLNINFKELRKGVLQYATIGMIVGVIMLMELVMVGVSWYAAPAFELTAAAATPAMTEVTNTDALGRLFYTHYVYLFQAAGMILLVAMIGAIVLTHRTREGVRKQSVSRQVHRDRREAITVKSVEPGQGL